MAGRKAADRTDGGRFRSGSPRRTGDRPSQGVRGSSGGSGGSTNFVLDFQPDPTGDRELSSNRDGGRGGWGGDGWDSSDNRTSFLQENVAGDYIHQIIGLPDDGFVQEVYIATTSDLQANRRNDGPGVASGQTSENDPFGRGTATGNPQRVIMRQRLQDSDSINEFLKDVFATKPVITTTVDGGDIVSNFVIDMNEISYNDMNTPGRITNTLVFTGPADPAAADPSQGPQNFDAATDAQDTRVSAGRYTYATGSGRLGSQGRYTYFDGDGFDLNIDWSIFCDSAQNRNNSSDGGRSWGSGGSNYCEGGSSSGGSGGWGGGGSSSGW